MKEEILIAELAKKLNMDTDKSDVISAEEMRKYFGESMYNYLLNMINT